MEAEAPSSRILPLEWTDGPLGMDTQPRIKASHLLIIARTEEENIPWRRRQGKEEQWLPEDSFLPREVFPEVMQSRYLFILSPRGRGHRKILPN